MKYFKFRRLQMDILYLMRVYTCPQLSITPGKVCPKRQLNVLSPHSVSKGWIKKKEKKSRRKVDNEIVDMLKVTGT